MQISPSVMVLPDKMANKGKFRYYKSTQLFLLCTNKVCKVCFFQQAIGMRTSRLFLLRTLRCDISSGLLPICSSVYVCNCRNAPVSVMNKHHYILWYTYFHWTVKYNCVKCVKHSTRSPKLKFTPALSYKKHSNIFLDHLLLQLICL